MLYGYNLIKSVFKGISGGKLLIPFLIMILPMTSTAIENMVVKSPNDQRDYKTFMLPNQMEVLLISDPSSDQAAVSLDILTGQINDPVERQGLAHFLEHMLFLGNDKYPEPEGFGKYLSSHGGQSNAYTAFEDTNFFFSIQNDYLEGALDRFAQFFISPTFDAAFVEREINAVNSEHNKNIKDDRRRIYRVLKEISNPEHPYHQFATGNLETLKGNDVDYAPLRNRLIQYFEEHYSSNLMKLVLVGKDPLEKLEELARKHFSSIENKKLVPGSFKNTPILGDYLPRRVHIQPVKAMRQLRLSFPISSYRKNYRSKPGSVISHLLGDEGAGSVLSLLKQKGWATSLSAGSGFGTREFAFFGIEISLTQEGLNHVDEITRIVFQYIGLIKKSENLVQYFEEMGKIASIGFQFKEKEGAIDYARYLASVMQDVPGFEAVASRWLYEKYRADLVAELLSKLTVENVQVVLVAPGLRVDRTEKWYGAKYTVDPVLKDQQALWRTPVKNAFFKLPGPNPFIPENIELKPLMMEGEAPILLKNNGLVRIWFKQDNQFRIPKGNVQVKMSSEKAYSSPRNAALTKLFALMLKDQLNEFSYPASLAGLNYSLSNSIDGLNISLSGYSENVYQLLFQIVNTMKDFKPNKEKFQIFRQQMKERRLNQKLAQAFQRITYESFHLLSETMWHTDEYLEIIDKITDKELEEFVPDLLKQLKIEMMFHGNFSVNEAQKLATLLEDHFTDKTLEPVSGVEEKTMVIPVSPEYTYQLQVEDVNSAIELYYQVGPKSLKQSVTLDMIQQILAKPFYHQLRTIEQLGYLVWSGFQQINKVEGFYFIIQSSAKDPVFLQERIELFIKSFYEKIQTLSPAEFEQYREALIAKRMEPPKNLSEETLRFWSEITLENYDFGRLDKEVEILKTLKPDEVSQAYYQVFINPKTERKLTIQAFGKKHQLRKAADKLISDVKGFKAEMTFFPNSPAELKVPLIAN
jgi:insulysin